MGTPSEEIRKQNDPWFRACGDVALIVGALSDGCGSLGLLFLEKILREHVGETHRVILADVGMSIDDQCISLLQLLRKSNVFARIQDGNFNGVQSKMEEWVLKRVLLANASGIDRALSSELRMISIESSRENNEVSNNTILLNENESNEIYSHVGIVIHCGLDFSLSLDSEIALGINVEFTQRFLEIIAAKCPRIVSVLILSSHFVQPLSAVRARTPLEERLLLSNPAQKRVFASASHASLALMEQRSSLLAHRLGLSLLIVRVPPLGPSLGFPFRGFCSKSLVESSPVCILTSQVAQGTIRCISADPSAGLHLIPADVCVDHVFVALERHVVDVRLSREQASHIQGVSGATNANPLLDSKVAQRGTHRIESSLPVRIGALSRTDYSKSAISPPPPPPGTVRTVNLVDRTGSIRVVNMVCLADTILRWDAVTHSIGSSLQRISSQSGQNEDAIPPSLYILPTRAHVERDLVFSHFPQKIRKDGFASANSWISKARRVLHELRPFIRFEWRVQALQLRRQSAIELSSEEKNLNWSNYIALLVAAVTRMRLSSSSSSLENDDERDVSESLVVGSDFATEDEFSASRDVLETPLGAPRGLAADIRFLLTSSYRTRTPVSTPQERARVLEATIKSVRVQRAIDSEVQRRRANPEGNETGKKIDRTSIENEAKEILEGMAAQLSVGKLRIFGYVFRKFWQRLYSEITINSRGLSLLQQLSPVEHQNSSSVIVYVPSHRSYMDFLVLSYVLFAQHLPLPHIAAGDDFLGLALAVKVLRAGGAFFMRRSLGNDSIYSSLLREYVTELLAHGAPLEFFPEGTRARFGKTLRPKLGLVRVVVDAWRARRVRTVHFVPVTINYERLVEGEAYPRELLGLPKRPETLRSMFAARSVLHEHYGRIAIQIGTPITLDSHTLMHEWPPELTENEVRMRTVGLGDQIAWNLQLGAQWSAVCIVSALLLVPDVRSRGVSKIDLEKRIEIIVGELKRRKAGHIDWISSQKSTALLERALEFIPRQIESVNDGNENGARIRVKNDAEAVLVLANYRNKLLHVFSPQSRIVLAIHSRDLSPTKLNDLENDVKFLDTLLSAECVDRINPNSPPPFTEPLNDLSSLGILSTNISNEDSDLVQWASIARSEIDSEPIILRDFIASFLWPFLESYVLAARTLQFNLSNKEKPNEEVPVATLVSAAQASVLQGKWSSWALEAPAKETLTHSLNAFKRDKISSVDECARICEQMERFRMQREGKSVHQRSAKL